jgi:hypothetical protein
VIKCVDSADFSSVNITKSITIDCTGTSAGIVGAGFAAVSITTAGIVVTLRGLSIDGVGLGGVGVNFTNGSALHIENCRISGFHNIIGRGISFTPDLGVTAKLHVSDSVISSNGLPTSGGGIHIAGFGAARVVLTRVQVENNTHGILADGTGSTGSIVVHVRDSVVAGNTGNGIAAVTGTAPTGVVVDRSSSGANAGNGINAEGSAPLFISAARPWSATAGV